MPAASIALRLAALAAALAAACAAQTPSFVFSYRAPSAQSSVLVAPNGRVDFPATLLGKSSTLVFVAENRGDSAWNLRVTSVTGPGFSAGSPVDSQVDPGSVAVQNLTFTPPATGAQTGTLVVTLSRGDKIVSYVFFLSASGVAPDWVLSYIFSSNGNQTAIRDRDTLAFPATSTGQTSSVTFFISNRGTAEGAVNDVAWGGDAFKVSGLPLLPSTLAPAGEIRFTVAFSPLTRDTARGWLRLNLGGTIVAITLEGPGIGPAFTFQAISGDAVQTLVSGGALNIPATSIGATRTVAFEIRNTGNAEGRISAVSIRGTGLVLSDLPPIPYTLEAGSALTFQIAFTPTESGAIAGRLTIDSAWFDISATGLGARLKLSSRSGADLIPIASGAVFSLPNTPVGAKQVLSLVLTNDGNASRTVSSIVASGAAFSLSSLPALPAPLAPGDSLEFVLAFAPNATGSLSGALQIEDLAFTLRGVGAQPPALSAVSFLELPATSDPLQQPRVGLRIADPYPYEVTGTLTLGFTPDSFVDDPAIQFSTGSRTVDFRIPANSTEAQFGQSGNRVQFQTGTVAGAITLTAAFTVATVSITPDPAPVKSVALAAASPRIRSLQIGTRSASGFEVVVTGYSNTRSVTTLSLNFSGANLSGASLQSNVEAAFSSWFQGSGSRSYGGQFTAVVFVNVSGKLEDVQSVSATLANSLGTSPAATVNLR